MKMLYGCSLAVATLVAASAWGQATQTEPARPRAENPAPATSGARRADDGADSVRAPGGRRVEGQPGAQPGQEGEAGRQGGQRQSQGADAQIAALLAAGNRNEIEVSKFAQEKLQSGEAKEFAAMMIKEHTPVHQRMQQMASQAQQGGGQRRPGGAANSSDAVGGADRGAEGAGDAAEAVRRPREGAGAAAGGQQRRGGLNWMAFHRELADQCLESTQKMLGEHKGADFDKAYLGQQIVAHQEMHDKLTVLRNHASSELQQEIDQQLTSTKEHLDHVKKLMDENKDRPSNDKSPQRQ